jgi:hypothetical protein
MRSVSLGGADHELHATALVAAGLGLGAVGGFIGSLLREWRELSAGRGIPPRVSRTVQRPYASGGRSRQYARRAVAADAVGGRS